MNLQQILNIGIQILAVLFGAYQAFSHKKKNVLISMFLFNFLHLILMIFISDYATMLGLVVMNVRALVYIFQDKLKKYQWSNIIPWFFVCAQIAVICLSFKVWYQILAIIGPLFVTVVLWYVNDRQKIRLTLSMSDSLWFIYSIYAGLYIASVSRVIMVASQIIAMIKNQNNKEE